MKTILKNSEALTKFVTLDPTSTIADFRWYRPTNKLLYETVREAINHSGYVVTHETVLSDTKGDYMTYIVSFGLMNPTAKFPNVGYYQPTLVLFNRNGKRGSFHGLQALRNPIDNTLIFPEQIDALVTIPSLSIMDKPADMSFRLIANDARFEAYEKIAAFADRLQEPTFLSTEAFKNANGVVFGKFFFDKEMITSVQSTYCKGMLKGLLSQKTSFTPYDLYSLYSTMFYTYAHPRTYKETMTELTKDFSTRYPKVEEPKPMAAIPF